MNDRTREQLLGYLLGALEIAERDEVERRLAVDHEWQRELESLQEGLEPLDIGYEHYEPPAGLVERTCARVALHREAEKVIPSSARLPRATRPAAPGYRWSLADCVVAAGICLAAALLFFPAISNSRYIAQIASCENNLREIGVALSEYSDKAGAGYFPSVPTRGNRAFAGVYAPTLYDLGYLVRADAILCPSSSGVGRDATNQTPTLSQIDAATGPALISLQEMAGGSYGYNLGVIRGGVYSAPRNRGRTFFAMMADKPTQFHSNLHSANHGGRGTNILFEDGHVIFIAQHAAAPDFDDPFLNRRGVVEAGIDENDAVVGASPSPPFRHLRVDGSSGL